MHPYIHFQGSQIVTYDLLQLLSYFAFAFYMQKSLLKLGIPKSQIYVLIYLGFFVQYVGGTLLPFAYRWFYLHESPWLLIWKRSPGRFFHSVVLSFLLYLLLLCKIFKWPTKKVLDSFLTAVFLASAIGRVGCLMQGCCIGKPSTLPWAMTFPKYPNITLHPTQIYMFLAEISLFIFMLIFMKKWKKYDGQAFWLGVCLYSIYRFLIEYVRTNPIFFQYTFPSGHELSLTHAQVFSALLVVLSLGVLLAKRAHAPSKTP